MYNRCIKRILDIICALLALILFGWLYLIIALLVRIKIGRPIIFKQPRPGKKKKDGQEKIFCIYKFRTMTHEEDKEGNLLPDHIRLTAFGRKLREWSLDEIPEVINILKGDMSVVGPRPQLVRDMVFMSKEQRNRHNVRPGLTGWAQVNGRNGIEWEDKLNYDLEYIRKQGFLMDFKIVLLTIVRVFQRENVSYPGFDTAKDFGDALLDNGKIGICEYREKQAEAKKILRETGL